MKLYVKGTSPVREVLVENSDKSGSILVGFRTAGQKELMQNYEDFQLAEKEADSGDLRAYSKFAENKLREAIVYIKNASVGIAEDYELLDTIVIEDTRKAVALVGAWETPAECLSNLLDVYLDDITWLPSIRDAFENKPTETLEELEVKN